MTVSRFQAALQKIDQANDQDLNQKNYQGSVYPKELLQPHSRIFEGAFVDALLIG